ncbi:DUF6292 family protein [Umezawaea sp.]|uniref:DUF6292 family protein n=1 Tax=Umezawaea sp. TaxID=1955258 RepID=UPI002ED05399
MDADFDHEVTRKLRLQARQISEALGQQGESWCVEAVRPDALYLAVEGRLPSFPDDDLALTWREKRGWFAVVEHRGDNRLHEIAHFGVRGKPSPREVAEWVAGLLRDDPPRLADTA